MVQIYVRINVNSPRKVLKCIYRYADMFEHTEVVQIFKNKINTSYYVQLAYIACASISILLLTIISIAYKLILQALL